LGHRKNKRTGSPNFGDHRGRITGMGIKPKTARQRIGMCGKDSSSQRSIWAFLNNHRGFRWVCPAENVTEGGE
jgi:phage-related protein